MFDKEFFPTKFDTIEEMTADLKLEGAVIYEPQAGKGDIVDYCTARGANVIASEINPDLRRILRDKCKLIAEDCFTVTSDQISHINAILMNPPFKNGVDHLLHAYSIAPRGCKIVCLLPLSNVKNLHTVAREQLKTIIDSYGTIKELGDCFSDAERKTGVEVVMITITKAGQNYQSEFEGFFTDDEPEEGQENGLMSYNVVRDLVNRYVAAIKLYDDQLNTGLKMNALLSSFYGEDLCFSCTEKGLPKLRNEFKKDMQKAGWKFIFGKMNMEKYSTRGVKEDINKFVEQQTNVPFTMRNIYKMLEIVVGTASQRMDKALVEVFDKLTQHHDENRFNVEGWKTNSHYLVNKKFILPNICYQDQRWYKGESKIQTNYTGNEFDLMEDLVKALCYISGDNYETFGTLRQWINYPYKIVTDKAVSYYDSKNGGYHSLESEQKKLYEKGTAYKTVQTEAVYGVWFDWAYFRCKAFKKGSMHFEFKDEDLWGKFNQRIAKIKGFGLFEPKKQTAYQDRQTGRSKQEKNAHPAFCF